MKSFILDVKEFLPEILNDLKEEIQKETFPFASQRESLAKEILEGDFSLASWVQETWLKRQGKIHAFLQEHSLEEAMEVIPAISLYLFIVLSHRECSFLKELKTKATARKEVDLGKKKLEELLSIYKGQMRNLKKDEDDGSG